MLEERGQALEEKASGEAVRERGSGPAFMLVPEGWDSLCA